jgi:nucleoside 2-deoxyribosyltransferase
MPQPKKALRCFVAMAFGHAETDAVYEAARKVLRELGVIARRVDRIEHNDDIDNRIIAEIADADLVLADLTFARPSVYWEAGYAQARIPVIYIVRRDHLDRRTKDPCGHLHVHFDLQMRNIIAWSSARDPVFLKRLRSRTVNVIAPILRTKQEDKLQSQRIKTFDRLSFHAKRDQLVRLGADHFRRIGYSVIDLSRSTEKTRRYIVWYGPPVLPGAFIANKVDGDRLRSVFFQVVPSVTSEFIKLYKMAGDIVSESRRLDHPKVKQAEQDIVICSLGKSGLNRLRKGIPDAHVTDDDRVLIRDAEFTSESPAAMLPERQIFHVFESAPTLLNLRAELEARFVG